MSATPTIHIHHPRLSDFLIGCSAALVVDVIGQGASGLHRYLTGRGNRSRQMFLGLFCLVVLIGDLQASVWAPVSNLIGGGDVRAWLPGLTQALMFALPAGLLLSMLLIVNYRRAVD